MAAGILADMAIRVETTKALVYKFAWMADHRDKYGPSFSNEMISKAGIMRIYAVDATVWVADIAMQLMESNGLSSEYHLEKYLRNAKITQLWLGGQPASRYRFVPGHCDDTAEQLLFQRPYRDASCGYLTLLLIRMCLPNNIVCKPKIISHAVMTVGNVINTYTLL